MQQETDQLITGRHKLVPENARCAVCDDPASNRIIFGVVGSEFACAKHYAHWFQTGYSNEIITNNQAHDLDTWRAVFEKWLSHSKNVIEKKRLTNGDEDLVCGICEEECEPSTMVPVPKTMKEQLGDVPLPDGLPAVCPSCLSIWNMAKTGSKSKGAIEVNSFDELMGYCVESRLTRETLARAKAATCVCGSPASLPPPLSYLPVCKGL